MTIEAVEFFQSLQNGFFDLFFNLISFLGEQYVYIFILAVVYYAYDKKLGEFLAFALFFTGILNNVIKGIVSAQRPFEKYPDQITNLRPETSTGHSFPSGHTQNFTAFLFAEAFWTKKKVFFIVASILTLLMAISRMYLGVHFLEDVGVSLILGVVTAWFFAKFFKKVQNKENVLLKTYLVILVVFLPFIFILDGADLFKGYGLFLGFAIAMFIEKRYINFTMDVSLFKKAIRVVLGLVIMVSIQSGLGFIFDLLASEGSTLLNILDLIRYSLIALVGLGLYPFLFKKYNF